MKYKTNSLVSFLFLLPCLIFSQDKPTQTLEYEINRIYPSVSITKEDLNNAQNLSDINDNYPASWVKEYISVEISANCNGTIIKAMGKDNTLNEDQFDVINRADLGTDIHVLVKYIPDNILSIREVKEMDFSFVIDPAIDAQFVGGSDELIHYLKEKLIDNIPESTFRGYDLAAVKFTINEEGSITDPSFLWSSNDEKVDELLMEVICNMPAWRPAEYSNGKKIKQDFALTVGNMKSCVVNLLNIRRC